MVRRRLRQLRDRTKTWRSTNQVAPVLPVGPTVSIVVPVYNVEAYIAQCLDSLLNQTLRDIEIIVVDDCSPDASMDIARDYALADERIKVITLDHNVGLSGARNAGIAAASGTYLTFVDSDDMLLPTACATATKLLKKSGSDFAVYGYERFDSAGTQRAAHWITKIHAKTLPGVTAAQFPAVMANAMACSKMYRRSFWDRSALSFPVGIVFEDQPVSAKAYSLATSIDIVGKTLLQWRRREDQSSITQQLGSDENLAQHLASMTSSLEILGRDGDPSLPAHRLAQYLSNDFTYVVPTATHCTPKYWKLLVDGMRQLIARDDFADWMWQPIPAPARVAYELVLRDDHARLVEFYARGGRYVHNFRTEIIDEKVFVALPFYGDVGVGIGRSRFELSARHLQLITSVQRVWWADDSTLAVEGWAYIDNIDHERYPISTSATLVGASTGAQTMRLPCTLTPVREADVKSKNLWANPESAGFHIQISVGTLLDEDPSLTWHLELDATAGGVGASSRLTGFSPHGSAGRLHPRRFGDHTRVVANFSSAQELEVVVQHPALALVGISSTADAVRVTFDAGSTDWQTLRLSQGSRTIDAPVTANDDGTLWADVTSLADITDSQTSTWTVRAIDAEGTSAAIGWPPTATVQARSDPAMPRAYMSRAGNVSFDDAPTAIDITDAHIVDDVLILDVHVVGAHTDGAVIELSGRRAVTRVPVVLTPGDQQLRVPLEVSLWGAPTLPLPLGRYVVNFSAPGHRISTDVNQTLSGQTPRRFESPRLHAWLELSRRNQLAIRVVRPLLADERGRRHQRELHEWHAALTPEPAMGVVFFRSTLGENTASHAGAVHAELQRQQRGTITYWTVSDHSVPVPAGAISVVHESREWYRLLRNAEFIVENMQQSSFSAKAPHQKVIAISPDYPFEVMGHTHWQNLRLPQSEIDSFMRRAGEWDFLISPATYATPLLRREFGYDGKVLEIGHPRNDVLFAENRDELRAEARDRLGIGKQQTAVLFAPTFRDYSSTGGHGEQNTDLIDLQELTEALGSDYVILMHGHAFQSGAGVFGLLGAQLIDVTTYPDVADLFLAADVALLDYSPLRFDFALTGKPMVFLVPDRDHYLRKGDWLFEFEPTAPGPFVNDVDDTVAALRDLPQVQRTHARAYREFLDRYVDLDDGHASRRLTEAVFGSTSLR